MSKPYREYPTKGFNENKKRNAYIMMLLRDGLTYAEIMEALECSHMTVERASAKLREEQRAATLGHIPRLNQYAEREVIEMLERGVAIYKISRIFDVSRSVVFRIKAKHEASL
jgi:DNA-binding CsgD family transcriptional regulator